MQTRILSVLLFAVVLGVSVFAQETQGVITAKSVYRVIQVDGDVKDWDGIPPACIDPTGDGGAHYDFAAAYVANDKNNLYFRITFAETTSYGEYFWYINTAFDTDLDSNTGHKWSIVFGSEFNIQGTKVFDQRSGSWVSLEGESNEENDWGAFAYVPVSPTDSAILSKDVEFAVPRNLVYKNLDNGKPGLSNPDGSPLFDPTTNTFKMVFETEDENYSSVEWMPDPDPDTREAGIIYTFAQAPAPVNAWELY